MKTPILETERLILRPLNEDDVEAVFCWTGDERVTKYMIYPTHDNIDVTKQWIESLSQLPDNDYQWGFVQKDSGRLIGAGGIRWSEEYSAWAFGYNICFDCWNKGYTTEATRRMIKFIYESCGGRDFISDHAVDNPASGRVMEKCGLTFSHYGEYTKLDGSRTFKAKFYTMHLD